ncbi:hypothetical protein VB715_16790 [Crocosphaera sp. UHCC 0190]|uniref:hypothetical protein n=1 Tax=Crocosphaera sp. UHCC 0190 TaxID=3110246 RepID=UPI002B2133FF|nr:hypothetical protein [Crocosphaera sp. UHCC 0190]MEA5511432.1 hypothetical protein [Crocosphaera sp. UHCC 0190]
MGVFDYIIKDKKIITKSRLSYGLGFILGIRIVYWLKFFTPSTVFLSDIIAVQAAVISIAIPISFDVISRISERYKSSAIINKFNQQWQVQILPLLLIVNIGLSVCLKFFITNEPKFFWEIFFLWLAFVCFLIVLVVLALFFNIVKNYSVNTSYLLNQIYQDIDKNLSIDKLLKIKDKKKLEIIQNNLIESFEAIGDILVFEVSDKKANKTIKNGFLKIKDSIIILFQIKEINTELFERLLVSSDFYNLSQENPQEASFRLSFNSDETLITLTTAVNQITRIHETAINFKNDEISNYSVYNIIFLLKEISLNSGNNLVVKKLLNDLTDMGRISIKNQNSSAHVAFIRWYTNIVFSDYNQFDLSYLDIFDQYLWSSIKYIIAQDKIQIFNGLVSTVTEGITISISSPDKNIYNYFQRYTHYSKTYDNEIADNLLNLHLKRHHIYTQDELNNWINQFYKLKNIVDIELKQIANKPNIQSDVESVQTIIRDVTDEFKYKNLKVIIFYTAAYCLFKEQFYYIKYLWNFNQPSDADASFVNRNIVPSGLGNIIYFYFKSNLIQRRYWWDDHHGSEIYVKKYFLLLLIKEFSKIDPNNYQLTIDNFKLAEQLDHNNLFLIKCYIDEHIKVSEEIKQDDNLLRNLDFDLTKVSKSIEQGVIPFLQALKIKAEEKIIILKRKQKISTKKVQDFKDGFLKSFSELSHAREIFENFGLYEEKVNNNKVEKDYGYITSLDKTFLLENWSNFSTSGENMGESFARELAISENKKIIQDISESCEIVDKNSLENILDNLKEIIQDIFIIASFEVMENWRNLQKFKDKCYPDIKRLNLKSFKGYYLYKQSQIPVLFIDSQITENNILILNKSRLGNLIQYLYDNENTEKPQQFNIDIKAFSEDAELLTNFLDNPSELLLEKGGRKQQQEYLEEQVSIKIIENFKFRKHPEFQGYIIPLEN